MVRVVQEIEERWGPLPVYVHPEWRERFPFLVHGITGRPPAVEAARLALGDRDAFVRELARLGGLRRVVGAEQVHGADVLVVGAGPGVGPDGAVADALITAEPRLGLAVLVADCVPVFLVDARGRAAGIVHAGWRGTAAGVLEAAIEAMRAELGVEPLELHVHLGPSICGRCYDVGPEVFEALGLPAPPHKGFLDLAGVLAARGEALGVRPDRVSRSAYCTRCDEERFHSYRGEAGTSARMAAFVALR